VDGFAEVEVRGVEEEHSRITWPGALWMALRSQYTTLALRVPLCS
jgi:hypothetical protein